MRGKENSEFSVVIERTDRKPFTAEGLRYFPQSTFEADVSLCGGDGADNLVFVVIYLWQAVGHRARTGAVAACRNIVVQCLVWPVEILDGSPLIERSLDVVKVAVAPEGEHLGLQRTMEAFVLASALRMIGSAVDHA